MIDLALVRSIAAAVATCFALQACVPLVVAGVGTGVVATLDRRDYGTQLEDKELEVKIDHQISTQYGERANVSAHAFNLQVLLTGQVADASIKAEAERIARGMANVKNVINEISVGKIASFAERSNDALISSNVKAVLVKAADTEAKHINVTTELNTVYLMGLVTAREADAAVAAASTAKGVQRVVRVFELVSEEEARRLSQKSASEQSRPAP